MAKFAGDPWVYRFHRRVFVIGNEQILIALYLLSFGVAITGFSPLSMGFMPPQY